MAGGTRTRRRARLLRYEKRVLLGHPLGEDERRELVTAARAGVVRALRRELGHRERTLSPHRRQPGGRASRSARLARLLAVAGTVRERHYPSHDLHVLLRHRLPLHPAPA